MSMVSSESPIANILMVNSTHTPTYYLLLKLIRQLGIQREVLLRVIHTIPFIIGLLLGYFTLVNVFGRTRSSLISFCIAVILPNYIFYATNLRMYSLLFMFSMAFIATVAWILQENSKNLSQWQITALGLSSLGLLLSDYSGIVYFLVGLIFLIVQAFRMRSYKPLIPILVSVLIFVIIIFSCFNFLETVHNILNWPVAASQNINNSSRGLVELAKLAYLSLRPGLDLIYSAGISLPLALGLPIVLLLLYAYSFVSIWKTHKSSLAVQLILISSVIWVFASVTGYSFTRIFLPSHFFMVFIIVYHVSSMSKTWKVASYLILGLMISLCLKEVIRPTLRLYNLIPYEQIATDTLNLAKSQKANTILLSNNSLNSLSIERYLSQQIEQSKIEAAQVVKLGSNTLKKINNNELNSPVIFISHMKEGEKFQDVQIISKQLNKSFQEIQGYIKLQDLPYNPLWKKRITNSAQQPYAVQSYLLGN
ncbi:glycosyltransferase family 39 protein [Xenococcus sp. PCC 7305]|uniref:glycosyltransferase family 39 protein n=1 Tax=Xenococcus sp. PCC 7305 TaxID=102125 RepID=UPI00130DE891|nr:glycosyltransferase family 39 protein [Xenococcus sp. PCC 7305]